MKLLTEGIGACTPSYWERLLAKGREARLKKDIQYMINPRSAKFSPFILSVDPYSKEQAEACGISLKGEMTEEELLKVYEDVPMFDHSTPTHTTEFDKEVVEIYTGNTPKKLTLKPIEIEQNSYINQVLKFAKEFKASVLSNINYYHDDSLKNRNNE